MVWILVATISANVPRGNIGDIEMNQITLNGKPYSVGIDEAVGEDRTVYTCPKCHQSFEALFLFLKHAREQHGDRRI